MHLASRMVWLFANDMTLTSLPRADQPALGPSTAGANRVCLTLPLGNGRIRPFRRTLGSLPSVKRSAAFSAKRGGTAVCQVALSQSSAHHLRLGGPASR